MPDVHLTASGIAIFTRKYPLHVILVLASSQVKLSSAGSRSDCADFNRRHRWISKEAQSLFVAVRVVWEAAFPELHFKACNGSTIAWTATLEVLSGKRSAVITGFCKAGQAWAV